MNDVTNTVAAGIGIGLVIFWIIAGLVILLLWIFALASVGMSASRDAVAKGVWVIVILISPVVGSIVYFAIGRKLLRQSAPPA